MEAQQENLQIQYSDLGNFILIFRKTILLDGLDSTKAL